MTGGGKPPCRLGGASRPRDGIADSHVRRERRRLVPHSVRAGERHGKVAGQAECAKLGRRAAVLVAPRRRGGLGSGARGAGGFGFLKHRHEHRSKESSRETPNDVAGRRMRIDWRMLSDGTGRGAVPCGGDLVRAAGSTASKDGYGRRWEQCAVSADKRRQMPPEGTADQVSQ